jgi:hypothetical protein
MAYDDNGEPVAISHFDFDAVERHLGELTTASRRVEHLTQAELDNAVATFQRLMQWIWQSGMRNDEGLKIRSIIACWVFLPELRPMTLTELARGFGKKKQSLGRWVHHFKRQFKFHTPHMRSPQR